MALVKGHAFWNACTGSKLVFQMDAPVQGCHLQSLTVQVYTIARPVVYHVYITFVDGTCAWPHFVHKRDALAIIKKEWMTHFYSHTHLVYVEHTRVDLRRFLRKSKEGDSSSTDSTPVVSPREDESILLSPHPVRGMPRLTPASPRFSGGERKSSSPRDWIRRRWNLDDNGGDGSSPTMAADRRASFDASIMKEDSGAPSSPRGRIKNGGAQSAENSPRRLRK